MKSKHEILKILYSSENYVSGEYIGRQLNISRAAVSKTVAALRADGYNISAVNNRGYLLINKEDAINSSTIEGATGLKTELYDELTSTSDRAKLLEATGCSGAIVIARRQTNGRARRGKEFKSDLGGTYFSALIKRDLPIGSANAIVEELLKITADYAGGEINENTVIKDGKKLCGILAEISADEDFIHSVILGIGIYPDPLLPPKTELIISLTNAALAVADKLNKSI